MIVVINNFGVNEMKRTIGKCDFRDAFRIRPDNFSYDGLGALYDFLEEVDPDYELDVIALCCDYSEDDIEEVLKNYDIESIEDLRAETMIVWSNGVRVLYQQF